VEGAGSPPLSATVDLLGLNALDYAVVALYLVAVTTFGTYFARFQKTTGDYFLTGRSVPWWAICFTIVATETSTLTFIGAPAAAYAGNMTFLQLAAGYVIGRLLVSLLFIPAYFRGDLVTSYELLQRRFGSGVKTVAAGLFLITRSLADGIRLFATALVIAIVTGVPVSITVVTLGVAMMIYTERGGVAAVIWTDVVQMFIYVAGALVVFFALLAKIPGGWEEVVRLGVPAGKFTVIDLSLDPTKIYTLWAGVVGGIALTLATHGTDQYLVQRLLSARSQAAAQRGLMLSGLLVFVQFTLFLLIGAMLFAYHHHVPLSATLGRNDEILPRFIISALPHGAIGFIVAAIVAAALSPSLNAMAATTVNDFYLKYVRPDADQDTLMRLSRRATYAWGIVQLAVALGAQYMRQSVLDAGLSVLSLTTGPVLGAFMVGVLTRHVGSRAMLTGMLAGAVAMFAIWWTGALAWTWYAFAGSATTSLVALGLAMLPAFRIAPADSVTVVK
jgi:solute:Na+ symporter, SSS family